MSLRQSGCRQFHNLVPNAGKDLSFICSLDFCTNRLSANEKHRVVVKNYRYLLLFFSILLFCVLALYLQLTKQLEETQKSWKIPINKQIATVGQHTCSTNSKYTLFNKMPFILQWSRFSAKVWLCVPLARTRLLMLLWMP